MRTLLTTGEAAERAGVSRQTIHQWRLKGRLPVAETATLGGKVAGYLYRRADVDRARAARGYGFDQ